MKQKKIIFITGTGTGVGKTLLAALLLHHLRQTSGRTLAMKPFCSGGLGDVRLLQSLQPGELSNAEMNPFYFDQPIAPLVAAQKSRRIIRLKDVLDHIAKVALKCDRLIIEGSGGILVPLGKGFSVADLIAKLPCQIIVAAHNRLGTINHTLLTVNHLRSIGITAFDLKVVLMSGQHPDASSPDNQRIIANMVKPVIVLKVPFLGAKAASLSAVQQNSLGVKKILTKLLAQTKINNLKRRSAT